jgi:hypothetical protein
MLFVAILLKGYDAFCHIIVPTPRAKNRAGPSDEHPWTDLSAYMMESPGGLSAAEGAWKSGALAPAPDDGSEYPASMSGNN